MKKRLSYFTALFLIILPANLFALSDTTYYKGALDHQLQLALYDLYRTEHAEIVMLGNSITHGVNWNELLGRSDIVERGIPSDGIRDYLGRMNYIYRLKPKLCFVMGGVNDLYTGYPAELTAANFFKVVELLKSHNIIPVIQSTLFVAQKYAYSEVKNQEIALLNNLLKTYAEKNKIIYIDLNSRMSIGGKLRSELTYDGIHLNARGYAIWREEIEPVIHKYMSL